MLLSFSLYSTSKYQFCTGPVIRKINSILFNTLIEISYFLAGSGKIARIPFDSGKDQKVNKILRMDKTDEELLRNDPDLAGMFTDEEEGDESDSQNPVAFNFGRSAARGSKAARRSVPLIFYSVLPWFVVDILSDSRKLTCLPPSILLTVNVKHEFVFRIFNCAHCSEMALYRDEILKKDFIFAKIVISISKIHGN